MSSLQCQIANFGKFSKEKREVTRKEIRVKVGNGAQARFWVDFWVGEDSLMVMFPRLFGLSTLKEEVIANFGDGSEENGHESSNGEKSFLPGKRT